MPKGLPPASPPSLAHGFHTQHVLLRPLLRDSLDVDLPRFKINNMKVDTKRDRPSAPCPVGHNWSLSGERLKPRQRNDTFQTLHGLGKENQVLLTSFFWGRLTWELSPRLAMFSTKPVSQTDRFHRIPNSGPTRKSSLPVMVVEALLSSCLVPLQMEQAPHIQRPHLPESR